MDNTTIRFLSLSSVANLGNKCRYFYVNVKERIISVEEKHCADDFHLWTPLYLASDVLAFPSVGKCNKSRIHASFAKQGIATKITLPTGVKLSRLPAGHTNGVWFYSVYGVIQAVMKYASNQAQQIRLIEELMNTWKLKVNDDQLPENIDNLTVLDGIHTIPMPVDLQQNASFMSRNTLQLGGISIAQNEQVVISCIPSSGCVVSSKRPRFEGDVQQLEKGPDPDVPDVAVEVSISSEPFRKIPPTSKQESICAKGLSETKREINITQQELSPTANQDKRTESSSLTVATEEFSNESKNWNIKNATEYCNHWSNGKCKFASSENCMHRRELVVKKICKLVENLRSLQVTHTQCWLKKSTHLILDEILELEADLSNKEPHLRAGNLWNNLSLISITQWLGEQFNMLVPVVAEKVDSFKKANVNRIAELQSDRELIVELFPTAMCELFSKWVGVAIQESENDDCIGSANICGQNHQIHGSSKEINKLGIYSLLLLLLEFSNQALVSGVAHVLYPRFVA